MEVDLRCENDVQVDALTVVDFTMFMWFVSHFSVGVTRSLLSSCVSLLVINLLSIRERERGRKQTRDEIDLGTNLFLSRTQVLRAFFSRNSVQQHFKG